METTSVTGAITPVGLATATAGAQAQPHPGRDQGVTARSVPTSTHPTPAATAAVAAPPSQVVSVGRDATTGLVVVRYVDPETGQTVLQVPAEEVLRSIGELARSIHQEMEGK